MVQFLLIIYFDTGISVNTPTHLIVGKRRPRLEAAFLSDNDYLRRLQIRKGAAVYTPSLSSG